MQRAESEVIYASAAMPAPRSSSEIIKPSQVFLDLMMLKPLEKFNDGASGKHSGKSGVSSAKAKENQGGSAKVPSSQQQPPRAGSAKVPADTPRLGATAPGPKTPPNPTRQPNLGTKTQPPADRQLAVPTGGPSPECQPRQPAPTCAGERPSRLAANAGAIEQPAQAAARPRNFRPTAAASLERRNPSATSLGLGAAAQTTPSASYRIGVEAKQAPPRESGALQSSGKGARAPASPLFDRPRLMMSANRDRGHPQSGTPATHTRQTLDNGAPHDWTEMSLSKMKPASHSEASAELPLLLEAPWMNPQRRDIAKSQKAQEEESADESGSEDDDNSDVEWWDPRRATVYCC